MAKLNQIIALQAGKKAKAKETLTQAYHQIKKPDLFAGLARTYQPRDEAGEPQPDERKGVQVRVSELVRAVRDDLAEMYDIVATQDHANCQAAAAVVVDGRVVLPQTPVTHLLFLEKQLVDLKTFVEALPTLDPAEEWTRNESADLYASRPGRTNRTKKVPRNHVKAEATDRHPAQVEVYHEDVLVGTWTSIKFSGAVPASEKNETLRRVTALLEAVKSAREEANCMAVKEVKTGRAVLDFVFGPR